MEETGEPRRRYCMACRKLFDSQAEYLGHSCPKYAVVSDENDEPREEKVSRRQWSDLLRLVYVHNPFYVISACLVLYGLNSVFDTSAEAANAWALMGVLAAYSCLLAFAGVLIVKIGKVWEDARSILLIIFVLLLALSVSFDEILISRPEAGWPLLVAGLIFAVGMSEVLLKKLRIRLGVLFRVPYYALLSFFFLYPLYLAIPAHEPIRCDTQWGVFLFPAFASLLFLSLLPAIRRGAAYVRKNGTPWEWPWYPGILFGVLGFAVCVRSYYLTLSFDSLRGMDSIFGLYFLVPLVLSGSVLLFEMGRVSGTRALTRAAFVGPILAIMMSFPGGSHSQYDNFVRLVLDTTGSPVLPAAIGAGLFYLYALLRKERLGEIGLILSLLVCAVAGSRTIDLETLVAPRGLPVLFVALLEADLALRKRTSWRAFAASTGVMIALTIWLKGTWFTVWGGAIPFHISYAALLAWGALFGDRFARGLQNFGAYLLVILCFLAAFIARTPEWVGVVYVVVMVGVAFGYWRLVRNRLYLKAGRYVIGIGLLRNGWHVTRFIQRIRLPEGTGALVWGGVAFVVAFAISLIKGRIPQKLLWAPEWVRSLGSSEKGDTDV